MIRLRLFLAYLVFILLTACAVLSGFVFLFTDTLSYEIDQATAGSGSATLNMIGVTLKPTLPAGAAFLYLII